VSNMQSLQKLDYKSFGSFTKEIRKREGKYEEKKKELLEELAAANA